MKRRKKTREKQLSGKKEQDKAIQQREGCEAVTEHKRTGEVLSLTQEEWELTFDSVPDLIAILDNQHRVVRVNRAMADRLGCTPEQCVGIFCYRMVHGTDVPPRFCPHTETLADGLEHRAEVHEDRLQGDFLVSTTPLRNTEGRMIGSVHVARDITERKRMEERLRRFFDISPDLLCIAGFDGYFKELSLSWEEALGYSTEELLSRPWLDFVHPDDREATVGVGGELFEGREIIRFENRYRTKDDRYRWIEWHCTPLAKQGLIYCGARDITDRKEAEEALRKAHDELEVKVQERTFELSKAIELLRAEIAQRKRLEETLRESEQQVRFFASQYLTAQEMERKRVAGELHDSIASSLAAVKFSIEKTHEEMENSLARPESLIELASTVEQTINEVRRIMVDLRPAILDDLGIMPAMRWFCREFQKTYSHIRVESKIGISEDEVPDSLKTAVYRITQEAMNNIAKYSRATLVNLSLQINGGGLELTIQDNGQGFDPKSAIRGLGLSTMRERAELSGGSFSIQSGEGKGTVIHAEWRT